MTLKEAAKSLGVTPDNLRGAIARGSLKARKLGRDWIVGPKEVERYRVENRRRCPPPRSLSKESRRDLPDMRRRDADGAPA